MAYEAIIAGGGIMGLAAARALLERGVKKVAVLERYSVGHDRAASTDNTKAIRYEYSDSEMYSRMVGRSIELWRALEAATLADLYVNCGVVCWGRGEAEHARLSYKTVSKLGIPIREVSPEELCRLYPQFNRADISYATVNSAGGFLRASSCVAALASEVRRLGGEIREAAGVASLEQEGGRVLVRAESGEWLEASRVVLAVGAWGANFLPELGFTLPLTAHKQQVVYVSGLSHDFAPGRFPVYLNLNHDFYGFPLDGEGLLKAAIHFPGPFMDPDVPQPPDLPETERVVSLLDKYLPQAAKGRVALARVCMYDMTPDEDFIIDHLPGSANVVFATGFSGHGFKFGPLIGELAAALSLGEQPDFSLEPFALTRFDAQHMDQRKWANGS